MKLILINAALRLMKQVDVYQTWATSDGAVFTNLHDKKSVYITENILLLGDVEQFKLNSIFFRDLLSNNLIIKIKHNLDL